MTTGTTELNPGVGGSKVLHDTLTTVDGGAAPTGAVAQVMKVAFGTASDARQVDASNGLPIVSTDLGAKADASASSDSGTFSLIALMKRLLGKVPAQGSAAGSASLPVVLPLDLSVTGGASLSALNTDLLTGTVSGWYDAALFHSATIQIVASAGISAGAVFFEQTNDTTGASAGNIWPVEEDTSLTPTPQIAAITIAASTTRMFRGQVTARYVRVRISTAFVGGTVQAFAVFSQLPYQRLVQTVHQATAGNLNVTATVASTTVTSISAGTNAIGDVGVQVRANATGAASVLSVLSPATPAATVCKASAGRLLAISLQNSAAAIRSVKFWNTAQGSVTLGTTAAIFEVDIPAGGNVNVNFGDYGIGFATAITYAVTGAKGLTDNTGSLAANDVSGILVYA